MASDRYDKIRSRAYELWEKEGRPSGRERQHWEQAERELAREPGDIPNRGEQDETSVAEKPPETAASGKQEEPAAKAEPKGKRRTKRNRRLWKWLAEEGGGEPVAAT